MTVDFDGKNQSDFSSKAIFIFYLKEMLTTIWFLNMVRDGSAEVTARIGFPQSGIKWPEFTENDKILSLSVKIYDFGTKWQFLENTQCRYFQAGCKLSIKMFART